MKIVVCLLSFVLLLNSSILARLDGSGTSADPYLIKSVADLELFSANAEPGIDYWATGVVTALTCDLDLSGHDYNSAIINGEEYGQIFEPGFQGEYYNGEFRGNGKCISGFNFWLQTVGDCYFGLFSCTSGSAVISDLKVSGITGDVNTGGTYVGMIAGINAGTIRNCQVDITLSGSGPLRYFGGIAGINRGNITCCQIRGELVFSSGDYIGGICGQNESNISKCAGLARVSGLNLVGGIAGQNVSGDATPVIVDSYCNTDIYASQYTGGIAGINLSGDIQRCYFSGSVGGFIPGEIVSMSTSAISNCYYHEASGPNSEFGTVLSESQMKLRESFVNWDFNGTGGQPVWVIMPGEYPRLSCELKMVTVPALAGKTLAQATSALLAAGLTVGDVNYKSSFTVAKGLVISQEPASGSSLVSGGCVGLSISTGRPYSGGEGTPEKPYLISTADDLLEMARRCDDPANTGDLTGFFQLTADISLAGHSFDRAVICSNSEFAGYFDGFCRTISDVSIEQTVDKIQNLGLFGKLAKNGHISNLYLENCTIKAISENTQSGLLVGDCAGQLGCCYVQGEIIGRRICGGLAGSFSGMAMRSSARVVIKAGDYANLVGGMAGSAMPGCNFERCSTFADITVGTGAGSTGGFCGGNLGGTISDCLARATITCGDNSGFIGGFCGASNTVPVRCFADAVIHAGPGSHDLGGFAGQCNSVTNCYYYSSGVTTDGGGATKVSSSKLRFASSFAGFDFNEVWNTPGITGPELRTISRKTGDINLDGIVNMIDLAILAGQWLR